MKKLKSLDNYFINESVVGKYTTLSSEEIKMVQDSQPEDLGSDDTTKRSAIIKAIESAMMYFDAVEGKSLDIKSDIVSSFTDEETKTKLHNLAKTFVSSLNKIKAVEVSEIEPVSTQIQNIILKK